MRVMLLQHTQEPERVVAQAAKLCYSAAGVEAIAEN
jgi:thymidylate synthase (FAD)